MIDESPGVGRVFTGGTLRSGFAARPRRHVGGDCAKPAHGLDAGGSGAAAEDVCRGFDGAQLLRAATEIHRLRETPFSLGRRPAARLMDCGSVGGQVPWLMS
jgi:hypothetical protein